MEYYDKMQKTHLHFDAIKAFDKLRFEQPGLRDYGYKNIYKLDKCRKVTAFWYINYYIITKICTGDKSIE